MANLEFGRYGNRGVDVLGMALFQTLAQLGKAGGMAIQENRRKEEAGSIVQKLLETKYAPKGGTVMNPNGTLNPVEGYQEPFSMGNVAALGRLHEVSPAMAQALQMSYQMKQPSYFNLGADEIRYKQPPAGGPPIPWAIGPPKTMAPRNPRLDWTTQKDASGKPIIQKVGNVQHTVLEQIDLDTMKLTGLTKLGPGGSDASDIIRTTKDEDKRSSMVDSFNKLPNIQKSHQAMDFADNILNLVASGNPIAHGAIPTYMARASGEVGNLSEADKAPFGGSRAILDKLQQVFEQASTGQLDPRNQQFIKQLADTMRNSANANLDRNAKEYARQKSSAYKGREGFDEKSLYEMLYSGQGQSVSKPTSGRFTIERVE